MNNSRDGDASHCCIGTGSNLISCRNSGAKKVTLLSTTWCFCGYINAVWTYKGSTDAEDSSEAEINVPPPLELLAGTDSTADSSEFKNDIIVGDTKISCGAYQDDA